MEIVALNPECSDHYAKCAETREGEKEGIVTLILHRRAAVSARRLSVYQMFITPLFSDVWDGKSRLCNLPLPGRDPAPLCFMFKCNERRVTLFIFGPRGSIGRALRRARACGCCDGLRWGSPPAAVHKSAYAANNESKRVRTAAVWRYMLRCRVNASRPCEKVFQILF